MHHSYGQGCKDETLYLTVYLLDKYLEMCTLTDIRQLDLLAITAFYIAGKYEDIYPPKLDQILAWANFKKCSVMAMEMEVLTTLNFEMNVPTPIRFLEFFLWALGKENDQETLSFCKFLLDIALLENWQ